MSLIGYARVSSEDQDLGVQIDQLTAAGCTKLFSEKKSGTKLTERSELEKCLAYCRDGDVLMVTRLDRMARSMRDFANIMNGLQEKGCAFKCLLQPIDTTEESGPVGQLTMGVLAAVAEFETAVRAERQREGIDRAKAAGVYEKAKGRKITGAKWGAARRMLNRGTSYEGVSKVMGISDRALRLKFPDHVVRDYPAERAKPSRILAPEYEAATTELSAAPTTPSAGEPVEAQATLQTDPKSTSLLGKFFKRA